MHATKLTRLVEISELENVLMLRFGQGSVAVDKNHFETFVLQAERDGKSFNGLILGQVEFEDGTFHDLTLDWEIWLVSILPASKALRGSYFGVNVSEKGSGKQIGAAQRREARPVVSHHLLGCRLWRLGCAGTSRDAMG
jgi:hypothetical protein